MDIFNKYWIMVNESIKKDDKFKANFIIFLILNGNFEGNDLLEVKEYWHLVNFIPKLSSLLISKIILHLDLNVVYCSTISIIPIQVNLKLTHEIMLNLKYVEPRKSLKELVIILETEIKLFPTIDACHNETRDKLEDILIEIIRNISYINHKLTANWKREEIYQHMGYTMLYLLSLILLCPIHNEITRRILDNLMNNLLSVIKVISIDMYSYWLEVKEDRRNLQVIIAEKGYLVSEHLKDYEPAELLTQHIMNFKRKPKTIKDLIQEADIEEIIYNVNLSNEYQKDWFNAFIATDVFKNKKSSECLSKWAHLCNQNDVVRILYLSTNSAPEAKQAAIECARNLNIIDLQGTICKHFHQIKKTESIPIQEELRILLNMTEIDTNFLKEILIFLLQNPEYVLKTLYTDSLKKTAQVHRMLTIFKTINDVNINSLVITTFHEVYLSNPVSSENLICYQDLLKSLLDLKYFDCCLFKTVLYPCFNQLCVDCKYEELLCLLQLLNSIPIDHSEDNGSLNVIKQIFVLMETIRNNFLEFSAVNREVLQESVNLLLKFLPHQNQNDLLKLNINSPLNKCYIRHMNNETEMPIIHYIYPSIFTNDCTHSETVCKLLKLLSLCIQSEWILVIKELESNFPYSTILNLLREILILLGDVTKTQEISGNNEQVFGGLRYCLKQYSIVVKDVLQPEHRNLDDQISLTKSICLILKHIPKSMKEEEGLKLVGLISDESLRALKDNKEFIVSLVAIKDATITKLLAQRILA